jgi:hypothetical protein
MPELGPYGSVRGARGNSRPYRESRPLPRKATLLTHSGRSKRAIGTLEHTLAKIMGKSGDGPKLTWKGFGGYARDGDEAFQYEDGTLSRRRHAFVRFCGEQV